MDCCSSSSNTSVGDGVFRCGICLDLLYKPVVLACGHISCFWCVHKAMPGLRASCCAICRQQYYHFPSICRFLHLLLLKMEPLIYKSREKEILEEENVLGCFSPQFVDDVLSENVHADERDITKLPENRPRDGICKQISAADAQCAGCREFLFRPAVLNCGHVYCESCLVKPVNGPLTCQVCHSIHPGNLPKICLEMDKFLEEQFPKEYSARRENVCNMSSQCQQGDASFSTSHSQGRNAKSSTDTKDGFISLQEDLLNTHVGIGCDLCGMYPIIGKRYRCTDCKEKVGFDVCDSCYRTNSKLPGRFNQQHTPDHRLELDESRLLSKILMPKGSPSLSEDGEAEDREISENEE